MRVEILSSGVKTLVAQNGLRLIESDPEKMHGAPVFTGTRVPIQNLFDYIAGGDTLDVFLEDFPTVAREQALGVLESYREWLTENYAPAA